jgi:hypothetical protein
MTVPSLAVIVALVTTVTPPVEMIKFADDAPEGTVTESGTLALRLLDFRLMVIPDAGATAVSVTVPVDGVPPDTEVGETESVASVGTATVTV